MNKQLSDLLVPWYLFAVLILLPREKRSVHEAVTIALPSLDSSIYYVNLENGFR